MRKLLVVIATLQFAISAAAAQSQSAAPLSSGSFSIALDAVVPAEIQVHSLPPAAEQLAPQLGGFGYVVVERTNCTR
jgi:hypothetical protein